MTIEDLVFIDPVTGYFVADYPSFLSWLQNEYRGIYGADVYLEADSQDGQLLAIFARALQYVASVGGSTYNSFSPSTAQGVGLSRNVKINGISRLIPTNSSVDLTIVGAAGTTITNGIARDTLQQLWNLPSTVTIPGGGTITVTATAQLPGAVAAAANTVNEIFTPTRGWQTVNNASAASPGAPVETDAELRVRQAQSTALPSLTVIDGTQGAIENIPGVVACKIYENSTASTDGNGIPSHSIEAVVRGGDATAIAQAILDHKTPGTGTAGSTTETVYDSRGMPSVIHLQRPTLVTIEATITISAGTGYASSYEDLIKAAVAAYINSIGIGNSVLYSKIFSPAYLNGAVEGTTYTVSSITINKSGDPPGTSNLPIAFNAMAVSVVANITVVVT